MNELTGSEKQAGATARTSTMQFTGKAGEFFGIWIVNILLSIVTLGIYSAWAKVRTYQYFYGHTSLEGHAFRYLAKPLQILKGRIIAVLIFASYILLSQFLPLLGIALALALLILSPWMIVLSLKFNLRMTSFRNVRFNFHGSYGNAFKYFILLPFLSLFTLYLALPWAIRKMDSFIYSNISYGGRQVSVNTATSTYYKAVLMALGAAIGLIIVAIIAGSILGVSFISAGMHGTAAITSIIGIMGAYFFILMLATAIYKTVIRNHLFENSQITDVATFKSEVKIDDYMLLIASNALGIIFSLGLAYPWAKVRHAAYLASVTSVTVLPQADQLIDQVQQQSSALAEEAAGLFDIDISLT